ncbi:MAG: glycerol-3-phosphate 1-O-acyltransferase PlsY [Caldicoprobacter oshimai]|uniref:Glycerol-3-phosphate acyltransferase n=1 Tax=Caldicoprobacter faecalis TaxID=937334 RepID=A0A1I5TDY1_9FIRM|nr:glycerol-3-phosphate 1-O-acyltransferase PlsY [Caldicoprobacter faecalis]PZN12243.1 MAG: acyl-phosphate glycerol 3-phosphate acyltransferase [Caldicoprobacter oshimai]SFP81249.1 glycerol-3-phosphate acyltransferase PlsY [Caldicoprobacter faecalis]
MKLLIAVLAGYLLGSIPPSFLAGKIVRNIDIRQYGSGNAGATNVLRVLGVKAGIAVFLADILKGVLAALIGRWMGGETGAALAGFAAIVGHNWPVFLNFRGGKGIATSFGVLLVLFPLISIILFVIGVIIIAVTRYVSLGSITAAILFPILLVMFGYDWKMVLFGVLVGGLALYRHRSNISRLIEGKENKLGERARVQ